MAVELRHLRSRDARKCAGRRASEKAALTFELAEAADVRAREQTLARRKTRVVAMRAHDGRHGADDDPRLLVRVH
jgi:hypothetical protein